MPNYQMHFIETPKDVLDAYDALRTAGTGMRAWARFLMAVYGLVFVAGTVLAFIAPTEVHWWQVAVWVAIGTFISWRFIVRPTIIRHRLRRSPVQSVSVEVSDAGIVARVGDGDPAQRYWGELSCVLGNSRGLAIGLRDNTICWLPQRAFASPSSRCELELFIKSKLPVVGGVA